MPWKHPGTGQEFPTIQEQTEGCGSVIWNIFVFIFCLALGGNAYRLIFVDGVHGLGETIAAGFSCLMGIGGIIGVLALFSKRR
jgi:hypothetical protein